MKLCAFAVALLQLCSAKKHQKRNLRQWDDNERELQGLGADFTQAKVFPVPADDLGMRFNKFGSAAPTMTSKDFPMTQAQAVSLRHTRCVSLIHSSDCDECYMPIWRLIDQVGGMPTNPSSNPDSPFWKEMQEVTDMQNNRKKNLDPNTFMPLPKLWKNFTIHEVAEAVHDEFPGVHHIALVTQLLKEGATIDRNTVPSKCEYDFLRSTVMLSDLNTWSIAKVGPMSFGAKWYAGRARPEEVAFKIAKGELTTGVPAKLSADIKAMNLQTAPSYTAYPEGSPRHPSWPAMHSAASAGSLWIATVLNLTPEQFCEVQKLDYAISYARTVAGVHYPTDNTAGLNMGQQVLARQLPFYLKQRYGANRRTVRAKIAKYIFDWEKFGETECFKGGVKATA